MMPEKFMKDEYYRSMAIDKFAIPIMICLKLLCPVLKHVDEGVRGGSVDDLAKGYVTRSIPFL